MLDSSDISQSPEDAKEELERLFLFSVSWALGGLLEPDERPKFDHYLRQLCPNNMPSRGQAVVADDNDVDSIVGEFCGFPREACSKKCFLVGRSQLLCRYCAQLIVDETTFTTWCLFRRRS